MSLFNTILKSVKHRLGRSRKRWPLEVEQLENRAVPSGVQLGGLENLPLIFEANQGQAGPGINFVSRGDRYTLLLSADHALLSLRSVQGDNALLDMTIVGGNPTATAAGGQLLPGVSHYLIGDSSGWLTDIPQYGRVRYDYVYPGVDLVYYGNQKRLEYDFIVAPGADPGAIGLDFQGAEGLSLDEQGNLIVAVAGGAVLLQAPVTYQTIAGLRRDVSSRFVVSGGRTVSFQLGPYDASHALVIDPVLSYSTYLGGKNDEWGYGVGVDGKGNIYFAGTTGSSDLTTTPGAFDRHYSGPPPGPLFGWGDLFVRKFDPSGQKLLYSTYFGGRDTEFLTDMAVDRDGRVHLVGHVWGGAYNDFPLRNAYQKTYAGGRRKGDAFVTKFNANGSGLVFSTYLGGSQDEIGHSLAVDPQGYVYVTGETYSDNLPAHNALQPASSGGLDAFVAKFKPGGGVLYVSYFGSGGGGTIGQGIAADSSGNAYVTGPGNVPITPGAYNTSGPGSFVSKFNSSGSALIYSTYLVSGSGAADIALDGAGNAYIGGGANSSFVPTPGAFQQTFGGGYSDFFVVKLNAAGTGLIYATFVGGNGNELFFGGIVVHSGHAYITGSTYSGNYPVIRPVQRYHGGGYEDAVLTKLNIDGTRAIYSTYLGGSAEDRAENVAVNSQGDAFFTGGTRSGNFPLARPWQNRRYGVWDAFLSRVNDRVPMLRFSQLRYRVAENAGSIKIIVKRTGDLTKSVSVAFTTQIGTALAGSDYSSVSGKLTFFAGERNRAFSVRLRDDLLIEGDEHFFVALRSPKGALLDRRLATVTIADNDYGIKGSVWQDDNGDGIQDAAEPGVSGIVVELRRQSDGMVIASTSTNAAGNYQFVNPMPGDYSLHFKAPSGREYTALDQGGDDTIDSDVTPIEGTTNEALSDFFTMVDMGLQDLDAGLLPV